MGRPRDVVCACEWTDFPTAAHEVRGHALHRPVYFLIGMDERDFQIQSAVEDTVVVRAPKQALATFGTTSVRYYLVSEPTYRGIAELGKSVAQDPDETVVREGTVLAERPQVVTPYYLWRHEGFGDNAPHYLEWLMEQYGKDQPGLLYTYRNQGMETSIVSGGINEVAARIAERLNREDRRLEAVVQGSDNLWDVSLMKFIYEFTSDSARSNFEEMSTHGLLQTDRGVPREAHMRIQRLIEEARRGNVDPSDVHRELERWDLFDEYQDRFLALFKGRRR